MGSVEYYYFTFTVNHTFTAAIFNLSFTFTIHPFFFLFFFYNCNYTSHITLVTSAYQFITTTIWGAAKKRFIKFDTS